MHIISLLKCCAIRVCDLGDAPSLSPLLDEVMFMLLDNYYPMRLVPFVSSRRRTL